MVTGVYNILRNLFLIVGMGVNQAWVQVLLYKGPTRNH